VTACRSSRPVARSARLSPNRQFGRRLSKGKAAGASLAPACVCQGLCTTAPGDRTAFRVTRARVRAWLSVRYWVAAREGINQTWITAYVPFIVHYGDGQPLTKEIVETRIPKPRIYLTAVYWALTTITTVGCVVAVQLSVCLSVCRSVGLSVCRSVCRKCSRARGGDAPCQEQGPL
jgi:hypothetical protein